MFAQVPAAGQDLTGVIKNLKHIGSKMFESPLATVGFHLGFTEGFRAQAPRVQNGHRVASGIGRQQPNRECHRLDDANCAGS
jgi:hypothetical protein